MQLDLTQQPKGVLQFLVRLEVAFKFAPLATVRCVTVVFAAILVTHLSVHLSTALFRRIARIRKTRARPPLPSMDPSRPEPAYDASDLRIREKRALHSF